MPNPWDPQIVVDERLARLLLEPLLPISSLSLLGSGWDNAAYLVNEQLVFRFPQRQVAAELIEHEAKALPLIAGQISVPISCPTYFGKPTGLYPYAFLGYRFLPGTPACRSGMLSQHLVSELAEFLKELHAIPISDHIKSWAPGDEIERCNLPKRLGMLNTRLEDIVELPPGTSKEGVSRLAKELSEAQPWHRDALWVHGDLYSCHLLLKEDYALSGVIDWGDMHLGDPALDLSIAYSLFPKELRTHFWQVYGAVDENTQRRARFRAIWYGVVLSQYGEATNNGWMRQAGWHALVNGISCEP